MKWVALPADLDDPFHPNIRYVPLPRDARTALTDWVRLLETHWGCPACEHSPHPTDRRMEELRTMPYPEYLQTAEWQRTRRAKLTWADHHCRVCGTDRALHIHHLTYDHVGHEWLDELVVLCRTCHGDAHDDRDDQRRQRRRR